MGRFGVTFATKSRLNTRHSFEESLSMFGDAIVVALVIMNFVGIWRDSGMASSDPSIRLASHIGALFSVIWIAVLDC